MNSTRTLALFFRLSLPVVAILSLLLSSCANKKARGSATLGDEYSAEGYASQYGDTYEGYGQSGGGATGDIALKGRPDGVNFFSSSVNRSVFPAVYFGFDEYDVPNAEFGKVQQVANYLRSNSVNLIIAGHTDERGTAEYNRNLGELRAQSLRAALVQFGVDGGRVQTVSYGEEYPVDPSSTESAHAANRRGEFGFYR